MIFHFIFYTFTIMSNTKNLITWELKGFWRYPILYRLRSSRCAIKPKMDIFHRRIIYNDLMKEKQGLITNYYSGLWKLMNYFI
jgi:hypothetical protein